EYPASMSIDSPGIGTYTYTVHCRTRRCGSLTEPMRVEVGPDGHIAAVLLNAKFADSRNVVEMMGKEMDAARSEQ
ncbi:ANK1, partial [Symbiodinium sp. CCMP2456]